MYLYICVCISTTYHLQPVSTIFSYHDPDEPPPPDLPPPNPPNELPPPKPPPRELPPAHHGIEEPELTACEYLFEISWISYLVTT